ncbi:MAG: hypothetical protein ABI586_08295 [Candidatus Nanopelagicales bacterium]
MAVSISRRKLRHALIRHRRGASAACAFLAVLFGLSAFAPSNPSEATSQLLGGGARNGSGSAFSASLEESGLVAAPVRIADAESAALLKPGSLIDLIAADGRGKAAIVASDVEVLQVPEPDDQGLGGGSFGGALVVVAVSSTEATQLAATAAVGPLSVVLLG